MALCVFVRLMMLLRLGLSFEERDMILDKDLLANMLEDHQDLSGDPFQQLPPGEEGMFLSSAGGEDEVFHVLDDSTFKR